MVEQVNCTAVESKFPKLILSKKVDKWYSLRSINNIYMYYLKLTFFFLQTKPIWQHELNDQGNVNEIKVTGK